MPTLLPLAIVSLIAMWIIFFVAIIFYEEGDDKRTLLFVSSTILAILSIFAMLIPTYTVTEVPGYNVTITSANSVSKVAYPAVNETSINPPYSTPVITLYTIFALFQAFIFTIFAFWSFRYRLQYKTFKEFKDEMHKNRKLKGF